MISLMSGTIHATSPTGIVLLTTGGVGYDITTTRIFASEQRVGNIITITTYLKVSENAMQLFGFQSADERSFFELLLSVSGVGPKSAMNILALGSVDEIEAAIAREDATYLSAVQGIGKKTAERMVVELKAKVAKSAKNVEVAHSGTILAEVIDALVSMGYGKEEVKHIVTALPASESTEELLREALKKLSR